MSTPLSGKAVLVTGASAGIGRATAIALAQAGAKIIATGRRKPELDTLAKQCGGGAIETIVGDLNDARFVDDLANRARDVDILVNLAVARSMMERRRGHIIIMTSIAAREVYQLGVIYCATKHALSAFARGLRIESQGHGIKVTEIAPGMVDTDIRASIDHPRVLEALKVRKFTGLTPAEVAQAVVYAAQAAPNCCPDL